MAVNSNPCVVGNCSARLGASMNNITFRAPTTDILQAYYNEIGGIYTTDFPVTPSLYYNFTGDNFTENIVTYTLGARVNVLEYNTTVELVLQGTNVLSGPENHPMHLHGFGFYFVGSGCGNFDNETDPQSPGGEHCWGTQKLMGSRVINSELTNPGCGSCAVI
ncbi:unnamed protein product [Thlaspi arvense]|uniref:Plastocyanin-like domain-containing protein n=1 Tax=Thlaspi arvense TaxID=13288 RepID=A0AAU9SG59_THLAR|nr:unnamed protein product [Thlaspi arvense]